MSIRSEGAASILHARCGVQMVLLVAVLGSTGW